MRLALNIALFAGLVGLAQHMGGATLTILCSVIFVGLCLWSMLFEDNRW